MGKTFKILKSAAKFVFLCFAPLLLCAVGLALLCSDLICRLILLFRPKSARGPLASAGSVPFVRPTNASIVIPNWNGKDLLEKFLPSVIEAISENDELIVVDNASTDGSAELIRQRFPHVKLIVTERNLGFGGGSNLGIASARNRIVVLLNNDMRVTSDFLQPLLDGFTDDRVFAVSSQIFFSDPSRRREETGLTVGAFERGFIRVSHEVSPDIDTLFPTFYAGGGSTAYDRKKFLELGGFDRLFEPFYLEDTDLSYCAWRKGWKVLYQPGSRLFHEHRATIGKHYSREAILAYLKKNYVLMVWKNVHRPNWLLAHFLYLYGHMVLCWAGRETETRTTIGAFLHALRELPLALRCRWSALMRSRVSDADLFFQTRPSVFRDVFFQPPVHDHRGDRAAGDFRSPVPEISASEPNASSAGISRRGSANGSRSSRPLNILFVSPYSIYPPIHGGGVFMLEAIQELSKRNNVFVLMFVDRPEEAEPNRTLEAFVRKVDVYVRQYKPSRYFGLRSHAEDTFRDPAFAALVDKLVYLHDIDVIQFEYTQLAQYRLPLQHTPQCLFEHDVYFRSVGRQLLSNGGGILAKTSELVEWLRAIRFEIRETEKFDAIFTCHENEKQFLESFLGRRHPPIYSGLRAVIDVSSHCFPGGPRQPDSLLFVGNFQHRPNVEGLLYFCREVFPLIRARRPSVTFHIVGANDTPQLRQMLPQEAIRFHGQVPDIREPLARYSVFVCPILSGAGMRVKILEAFASGIPVVSTILGAEGMEVQNGKHLLLASTPEEFAAHTLRLLEDNAAAAAMAREARQLVEEVYDWPAAARKLEAIYRELIEQKRGLAAPAVTEPSESVLAR
jgi:GT2 family glycosyltransferase/glycosyltransferase involved in cell wall biosynthesis